MSFIVLNDRSLITTYFTENCLLHHYRQLTYFSSLLCHSDRQQSEEEKVCPPVSLSRRIYHVGQSIRDEILGCTIVTSSINLILCALIFQFLYLPALPKTAKYKLWTKPFRTRSHFQYIRLWFDHEVWHIAITGLHLPLCYTCINQLEFSSRPRTRLETMWWCCINLLYISTQLSLSAQPPGSV